MSVGNQRGTCGKNWHFQKNGQKWILWARSCGHSFLSNGFKMAISLHTKNVLRLLTDGVPTEINQDKVILNLCVLATTVQRRQGREIYPLCFGSPYFPRLNRHKFFKPYFWTVLKAPSFRYGIVSIFNSLCATLHEEHVDCLTGTTSGCGCFQSAKCTGPVFVWMSNCSWLSDSPIIDLSFDITPNGRI